MSSEQLTKFILEDKPSNILPINILYGEDKDKFNDLSLIYLRSFLIRLKNKIMKNAELSKSEGLPTYTPYPGDPFLLS